MVRPKSLPRIYVLVLNYITYSIAVFHESVCNSLSWDTLINIEKLPDIWQIWQIAQVLSLNFVKFYKETKTPGIIFKKYYSEVRALKIVL